MPTGHVVAPAPSGGLSIPGTPFPTYGADLDTWFAATTPLPSVSTAVRYLPDFEDVPTHLSFISLQANLFDNLIVHPSPLSYVSSLTMSSSKHGRTISHPRVSSNLKGTPNNRPKKSRNTTSTPGPGFAQTTLSSMVHQTPTLAKDNPSSVSPAEATPVNLGPLLSPSSPPSINNSSRSVDSSEGARAAVSRLSVHDSEAASKTVPLQDDVRLALLDEKTHQLRLQDSANRQRRVQEANASHLASTPYSFHRDGSFKASPAGKLQKSKSNVWNSALIPTHLEPLNPPTKDIKSILDIAVRSAPTPFSEVHAGRNWREGTLQDFHRLADVFFDKKATLPCRLQVEGQRLRDCFIGFSRMSPEIFGPSLYNSTTGSLLASPETFLWVAANKALGSSWRLSTRPAPPASRTPKVAFAATVSSRQTSTGTFLARSAVAICSKDARDGQSHVSQSAQRKYKSYFTLALPPLTTTSRSEQAAEAMSYLHDAFSLLWTCDSGLAIYVYPTRAFEPGPKKPLTTLPSRSCPQFSRRTIERYADRFYLRQNYRPWIRFYIGHQKDIAAFTQESFLASLSSRDITFSYDDIQAPTTIVCGWLLGTHRSLNLQHYGSLMRLNKKFVNHPVSLSSRGIRMFNGEKPSVEIRAVHVLCDASKRRSTCLLLKSQYNRGRPEDLATLPEGKLLKFIPYFANRGDRRPPPAVLNRYKLCRVRQLQFLDSHDTHVISGILDLDLLQDIGDLGLVSLRQVLLGIKTQVNWRWPLFLSVDFDNTRREITALFHKDNHEEASTFLDYLPLILDAQYGARVWNWFTPAARSDMESYQWNPDTRCVEPASPSEGGSDGDLSYLNFYGDSGTADWENVQDADLDPSDTPKISFDLGNHFNMRPATGGAGYDDQQSLPSFKTATSNATAAAAAAILAEASPSHVSTKELVIVVDGGDSSTTTSLTDVETTTSSRSSNPSPAGIPASARQTRVSLSNDK